MRNAIYWIWLQNALGFANAKTGFAVSGSVSARELFEMQRDELAELRQFTAKQIDRLCDKELSGVQDILTKCGLLGYDVLTPDDDDYPVRLKNIAAPPAVLYVSGALSQPERMLYVGIVGSREPSEIAADIAYRFAAELSYAGAVIVSGGARGIDSAAHSGALSVFGRTVAVLGCGIDYEYNMGKHSMRKMIASSGAVVSEYPPGTPSLSAYFPQRNRIISGLSHAVVVAQSGKRSGALITARCAADQGRDVYVIENPLGLPGSEGSEHLLESGAIPLVDPGMIINEYLASFGSTLKPGRKLDELQKDEESKPKRYDGDAEESVVEGLSENARSVYQYLKEDEKAHIDDIVRMTGIAPGRAAAALTELELLGMITALPGKNYRIKFI